PGDPAMWSLAAEVGDHSELAIWRYAACYAELLTNPGTRSVCSHDEPCLHAAPIFDTQPDTGRIDIEMSGARRTQQGHVVLPPQGFPQLEVHQGGFDDPCKLGQSGIVCQEVQPSAGVPVNRHARHADHAGSIKVLPDSALRKKRLTRGADRIDALIEPGRTLWSACLDQRDAQAASAQSHGETRASQSATYDQDIHLHARTPSEKPTHSARAGPRSH